MDTALASPYTDGHCTGLSHSDCISGRAMADGIACTTTAGNCPLQCVLVFSPSQMLQVPHQRLDGKGTFEPQSGGQRQKMVTRSAQVKSWKAVCLSLWSAPPSPAHAGHREPHSSGQSLLQQLRAALAAAALGSPCCRTVLFCSGGFSLSGVSEV